MARPRFGSSAHNTSSRLRAGTLQTYVGAALQTYAETRLSVSTRPIELEWPLHIFVMRILAGELRQAPTSLHHAGGGGGEVGSEAVPPAAGPPHAGRQSDQDAAAERLMQVSDSEGDLKVLEHCCADGSFLGNGIPDRCHQVCHGLSISCISTYQKTSVQSCLVRVPYLVSCKMFCSESAEPWPCP